MGVHSLFMDRGDLLSCSPKVYPLHDSRCWQHHGCAAGAVIPLQNILFIRFLFVYSSLHFWLDLTVWTSIMFSRLRCVAPRVFCIKILKCDTDTVYTRIAGSCSNLTPRQDQILLESQHFLLIVIICGLPIWHLTLSTRYGLYSAILLTCEI